MPEPIYKNVKSTYTEARAPFEGKDFRFFCYRQNNSGGSFHRSEDYDVVTIVPGTSSEDADRRAEELGIYFDGCSSDRDCSCCGDRWSRSYEDGDEEPLVYGQTPEAYVAGQFSRPVIIHYPDGSRRRVELVEPKSSLY